jgi:hypothetical protein
MLSSIRGWILRAGMSACVIAGSACARAPQAVVRYPPQQLTPDQEAVAIEAAKRNPIAQPRVRPAYPEQSPPPLARLPEQAPPPPPSYPPTSGPEDQSGFMPQGYSAPPPASPYPAYGYSAPYPNFGVGVYYEPWYARRYRYNSGWVDRPYYPPVRYPSRGGSYPSNQHYHSDYTPSRHGHYDSWSTPRSFHSDYHGGSQGSAPASRSFHGDYHGGGQVAAPSPQHFSPRASVIQSGGRPPRAVVHTRH